MEEIKCEQFAEAYAIYRKLTGSAFNYNTMLRYARFIGMSEDEYKKLYPRGDNVHNIPERCYNKIRGLLSPHARTLLKAWEAIDDDNLKEEAKRSVENLSSEP